MVGLWDVDPTYNTKNNSTKCIFSIGGKAEMGNDLKLFDLSQPFSRDIPVYHIYSRPTFGVYHTIQEDDFYDRTASFYTHSGTHIDAPRHFSKEGYYISQIPLDVLVNRGVVLDLHMDELGKITCDNLEKAARKAGLEKGDTVIINTGWHHRWEEPDYTTKFPGIVKSGAEWLVESGIKMVGVDWICIDHPSQTDMGDNSWASHGIVLSNNIPVIENIGGEVDMVSGQRVTITALPVKVIQGDGFPIRVIAAIE
jgi:kynurenine formamidase